MSQNGPFLSNGANQIRWTSDHLPQNRFQMFAYFFSRRKTSNLATLMVKGLLLLIRLVNFGNLVIDKVGYPIMEHVPCSSSVNQASV